SFLITKGLLDYQEMSVSKKKITPIFVIGAARNGTTNLCNLLSEIPSVAGATSIYHYGTCESSILRNKLYWGDLSQFENYFYFLSQIQYDDFFNIVNGNIQDLLEKRPSNYFDFICDLMDRFALEKRCDFWLTKLDPLFFIHTEY